MKLTIERIRSPVGEICLLLNDPNLCHLDYADCPERMERLLKRRFGSFSLVKAKHPSSVASSVNAYFQGDRYALTHVKLETGGTPFQQKVWQDLRKIPCGKTISYSELAESIGQPRAVRAVARANALNPIAIVIPCHRVISKDGSLSGYAGGVERKTWLIEHEAQGME